MIERADFLADKRLTERFLRRKLVRVQDLQKTLKSLPDLESECEYFNFIDEEGEQSDIAAETEADTESVEA